MTIIPELRGESDVIRLFLGGAFLALSLLGFFGNGSVATVVVSVAFLAMSLAILGMWLYLRLTPNFALTIGPDEIVYGRPNRPQTEIERDATGWLSISQDMEKGGFLIARDGDEDVWALMLGFGFDPGDVADACEAHGWPVSFGEGDPPARPLAARSRVRRRAAPTPMSKPTRIVVGTGIVVSLLVCLGALGVSNWYVALPSGIVMFAAILYSEGKW